MRERECGMVSNAFTKSVCIRSICPREYNCFVHSSIIFKSCRTLKSLQLCLYLVHHICDSSYLFHHLLFPTERLLRSVASTVIQQSNHLALYRPNKKINNNNINFTYCSVNSYFMVVGSR